MTRGEVILRDKKTDQGGNIRELVIWKVKPSHRHPEGVRYRLALIVQGERTPAVLYDNHHPKGHHRHLQGVEEPYNFVSVDRLLEDFRADVEHAVGASE